MNPAHLPLSQVNDGDLVIIDWPRDLHIGIKGSTSENAYVAVLGEIRDRDKEIPHPYLLTNTEDPEFYVVTLGSEWRFDFDPMSATFEHDGSARLNTLLITLDGTHLVCHSNSGKGVITHSGKAFVPNWNSPYVSDWKMLLKNSNGEYVEFPKPAS